MDTFAVIGLGRFGSNVAKTLSTMGHEVLCIDSNEDKIADAENFATHAITADAANPAVLKEIGINNFDTVVVAVGSFEDSILITLTCKEMHCNKVVVKASNEIHEKILYKIGADNVVLPERSMGIRVAHSLVSNSVLDTIELSSDYSLVEITAPPSWFGKTLSDLNLRSRLGITVITIRRNNNLIVSPSADDSIIENDILILVGNNEKIKRLTSRHLDR